MHNHTGCICLIFLHCVFSNVSSNCLHMRMHNHTGSICLSSPQFWLPSPELQYCHKIFSSHSCLDYAPSLQSRKQLRMEGLDFRIAVEEEGEVKIWLLSPGYWSIENDSALSLLLVKVRVFHFIIHHLKKERKSEQGETQTTTICPPALSIWSNFVNNLADGNREPTNFHMV